MKITIPSTVISLLCCSAYYTTLVVGFLPSASYLSNPTTNRPGHGDEMMKKKMMMIPDYESATSLLLSEESKDYGEAIKSAIIVLIFGGGYVSSFRMPSHLSVTIIWKMGSHCLSNSLARFLFSWICCDVFSLCLDGILI